jgi:hypothetical protein
LWEDRGLIRWDLLEGGYAGRQSGKEKVGGMLKDIKEKVEGGESKD